MLYFYVIFFCKHIVLVPTREESGLGLIEYDSLEETLEKKSKRINTKFTEKERFHIGKYTAINGPSDAVQKFRKLHPHLKFRESQARALRKNTWTKRKRDEMSIKKLAP